MKLLRTTSPASTMYSSPPVAISLCRHLNPFVTRSCAPEESALSLGRVSQCRRQQMSPSTCCGRSTSSPIPMTAQAECGSTPVTSFNSTPVRFPPLTGLRNPDQGVDRIFLGDLAKIPARHSFLRSRRETSRHSSLSAAIPSLPYPIEIAQSPHFSR